MYDYDFVEDLHETSRTFEQKLDMIRTTHENYFDDYMGYPEDVIFHFGHLTKEEADLLAQAFKDRFGEVYMLNQTSLNMKKPYTVMDMILDRFDHKYGRHDRPEPYELEIYWAFVNAGFKPAKEIELPELKVEFLSQSGYRKQFCEIFPIDYDMLKSRNEWLNKSLAEFFYHPDRIQKWIESGNELEDYLNV